MAYEGQDLIDYEAGEEYLPQRYYQQNFQRNITGPEIMGQNSGITNTQVAKPYIWPPQQGGGGGGGTGFGTWGDLDESSKKTFDKQVWGTTKPGGQKGWTSQPVTGYRNVKSGHYQTEEGKNINHLGLEIPSFIASAVNAAAGTKFGEKQVGDTKGRFTKDDVDEDQAIFERIVRRQKINAMRKDGIYKQIRPHGGGQDLSTVDTATSGDGNAGGVTLGSSTPAAGQTWHPGVGSNQGGQTTQAAADKAGGSELDSPFYAGGRAGYNRGRVVNPGGYAGETEYENWLIDNYDLLVTDLSFEDHSKYSKLFRSQKKAHGGRIGYRDPGGLVGGVEEPTTESQTIEMGGGNDGIKFIIIDGKIVAVPQETEPKIRYDIMNEELIQKASGGRVPFFYGGLATIL